MGTPNKDSNGEIFKIQANLIITLPLGSIETETNLGATTWPFYIEKRIIMTASRNSLVNPFKNFKLAWKIDNTTK